jgi:outer membrane immunogenic protein
LYSLKEGINMKFKTKLLVAAGAMVLAGAASAQAHNWNGYYVGFNVGGQRGTADVGTSFADVSGYFANSSLGLISQASMGSPSRTQFHGGVSFGNNWLNANQVMGYEMDLSFSDMRLDRSASAFYTCGGNCVGTSFAVSQQVRVGKFATVRGRWGVLTGSGLLYATGGLAIGRVSSSTQFADDWGPATASTSTRKLRTGVALGFGYEQPMSNGWTFKGEYLRVDLGKVTSTNNNLTWGNAVYSNQPISSTADIKLDIVRVGFNKKF